MKLFKSHTAAATLEINHFDPVPDKFQVDRVDPVVVAITIETAVRIRVGDGISSKS